MSDAFYGDSIEDFDLDGAVHYEAEPHNDYTNRHCVVNREAFDDYYEDVEPDLSSPTPVMLPRSRDTAYRNPNHFDSRRAALSGQVRQTSSGTGRYDRFDGGMFTPQGFGTSSEPSRPLTYSVPPDLSNPRNAHGVRLRPVSDLPDIYRTLFKFGVFNAVQSKCFGDVYGGDDNAVISAPTGSGKTVLFELGIIRMVEKNKSNGKQGKCIYVAPTKALCTEKYQEWVKKFEPLGLKCCELTGDTVVFGHNAWGDAKNATIIVTTCEKWDSLTRNWHDHEHILSQIQLFLVDEVHILNESRGSTLEVVISRMKFRGNSIRFIMVSATVPNIEDLAKWIGNGSSAAKVFEFGDEYRPCQLTRHVVGVHRRNGTNDFQFARVLDCKLFSVLQQHSAGKPILIFCPTRKGVMDSAEQLLKEFSEIESKRGALPWTRPRRIEHTFHDKRLNEFACAGIGVHHAGISTDDRRATEQLYLNKNLRILIATSTLAVGVNLPAHMVVIKGVHMFQNNASKEYSDLDVMQMLGRAGRPQFDKDGIAVIMCESGLEEKYKALVQGKTILESSLHNNLSEHLNSEICLGTITDTESAKTWLRSSFLYQRMRRNPQYYALNPGNDWKAGEVVDEVVMNSIAQLKQTLLIEKNEEEPDSKRLSCTEYGEIMSKYYIRRATMDLILSIPERASLKQILEFICAAEEFQDVKLRNSEKAAFNRLRKDMDIRFEVKKVEKTTDKVLLLVQAVLGGISLNNPDYKNADSQPHLEAFSVFKHISRIARATLDVAIVKKDGLLIKNSLELFRCLSAKAWEDRPVVFRQIEQIGEKSIKVLAEHGVTSFALLRKQSPLKIETLLNRRPPFGLEVLASVAELPQYTLAIEEIEVHSSKGDGPVCAKLLIKCGLSEGTFCVAKSKKPRGRTFQMTTILTLTSDMTFVDVRRIPTKSLKNAKSFEVNAELTKPSQNVVVIITSETIAGVALQEIYKPDVLPGEYPTLDTRPLSSVEMDLVGLEEDSDFWNMTLDSGEDDAVKDVQERLSNTRDQEEPSRGSTEKTEIRHNTEKSEARLRPDGRYECNHSCKRKDSCLHFCCRDGVEGPPKKRRRILEQQPSQKPNSTSQSTVQKLHTQSSSAQKQKENRAIKALDSIHEQAHVASNLNLKEGKRLKVQSPPTAGKRKRRPPVDYNISFVDLRDPDPVRNDVPEIDSDADELPMAILTASVSSQTHKETKGKSTQRSNNTKPAKANEHRAKRAVLSPTNPVQKRSPGTKKALFLESSDSEGSIEVITPAKSKATRDEPREYAVTLFDESISSTLESTTSPMASPKPSPTHRGDIDSKTSKGTEISDPIEQDNDEFAELDAWLESGSVRIL